MQELKDFATGLLMMVLAALAVVGAWETLAALLRWLLG